MDDIDISDDAYADSLRSRRERKRQTKATNGSLENTQAFSEDALALDFAEQRAGDLRYCAEWSHWLRYDGARWQQDKTLHVFDTVRALCRAKAATCNKLKLAKVLT